MSTTSRNASDTRSPPLNTRNNAALGMIGGTFVGIMAFTTPFVFMQLRSSLPYMATPRRKVERALKFIISQRASSATSAAASNHRNKMVSLKPNYNQTQQQQQPLKSNNKQQLNFVDLGSGDGTTILAAASLGWNATGLELNPTLWFVSSIRRILFSPKMIRTNSQLVLGDMFENRIAKERLQGANCVMIFGVRSLMPNIADLVQRECRPGCFLMSYRFRVPLLHDKKKAVTSDNDKSHNASSSPLGSINASLIYDEEEMRIYQLLDEIDETI